MTLTQLRYVVEVADAGSITAAAARLFIAQPSLSKAVGELEAEMGVQIFERSSRGVAPTEEGTRFLSYARQVVEQADLLESRYAHGAPVRRVFAVSSQHYAFVVNAFVELVREIGGQKYEFSLREGTTAGIIDDVRTQRSEVGVIYLSHYNREVIMGAVRRAELRFEPLFCARPHVFVSRKNPLAAAPQRHAGGPRAVPTPHLRPGRAELVLLLGGAARRGAGGPPDRGHGPRHPLQPAHWPGRLHRKLGHPLGGPQRHGHRGRAP